MNHLTSHFEFVIEFAMFVVEETVNEDLSFNTIYEQVAGFEGLDPIVDPVVITKVVSGVYPGVTTQQLDELSAGRYL